MSLLLPLVLMLHSVVRLSQLHIKRTKSDKWIHPLRVLHFFALHCIMPMHWHSGVFCRTVSSNLMLQALTRLARM